MIADLTAIWVAMLTVRLPINRQFPLSGGVP